MGAPSDTARMSATQGCSEEDLARFDEAKASGNAAFRERRYHDAVTHYTRAEAINPCVAVIPANRAMAHLKLENWEAVNADATVALALQDEFAMEPGHFGLRVKCHLRRARARTALGREPLAVDDYRAVLAIDAENQDAKAALRRLRVPEEEGNAPKITVVGEGDAGVAESNGEAVRETNGLVRDFPLMRIGGLGDSGALGALTRKWTSAPPRNVTEFERAWKSTQGEDVARAEYLVLIGAQRIRQGLFGNSMTPQLLGEIVAALGAYAGAVSVAVEVFHAVCSVERIGIVSMLLPESDRRDAMELCDRWSRNGGDATRIDAIREVLRD